MSTTSIVLAPGLALDRQTLGRLAVEPGAGALVLHAVLDLGDVAEPDRRAVAPGDDDLAEPGGVENLVVRVERDGLVRPGQVAVRPVDAGCRDRGADVLDADAARRQRRRVDPHQHGVGLLAENARFGDAADARQTLRHHRKGIVVKAIDRYRVGMDRVDQHGTVGRVGLPVGRRVRHVARQQAGCRLDRLLHVLRRGVDIAVEFELHRDRRVADPARRTHLGEAGQRGEFLFERRGNRRGHRRGAGAGIIGADHDRREIDAR